MSTSNLATAQREKEGKRLKTFLLWSLLGSTIVHGLVLASRPSSWLQNPENLLEEEVEVVIDNSPEPQEEIVQEQVEAPEPVESEPQAIEEISQEVAFAPEIAPPPAPALAPDSQAPQPAGEDAPSDKPLPISPETVNPMTSETGEIKVPVGGGPISKPGSTGSGFGNATQPTGFVPGGRPDGDLKGKPTGVPGGKPDGLPGGNPNGVPGGVPNSTATRGSAPAVPIAPTKLRKPQCLSCPKPTYRGKEGTPRVTYDIAPDGRVVNVRLRKSSGDPNTDRETLEVMSKWQFDAKTLPEGGQQNVRVRVTFEEAGSNFQQQNEQRRREQEQRRIVEQEQQQQEAEQRTRLTPTTATEPTAKPESLQTPALAPAAEMLPAPVTPSSNPVPEPAPIEPAPVEAAPLPETVPELAPLPEPIPEAASPELLPEVNPIPEAAPPLTSP